MAKVTWHPKKEEREITFLYHIFINGDDRPRRSAVMESIEDKTSKLESFIYNVVADRYERRERMLLVNELKKIGSSLYRRDFEEQNAIKTLMLDVFNAHCLSADSFSWIDPDNERLCNFVWSYILTSIYRGDVLECKQSLSIKDEKQGTNGERPESVIELIPPHRENEYVYLDFKLPLHVTSSREKRECIVHFFDLWTASRRKKERQLEYFSHTWGQIKNKSKMEDWLIKNEEMAEWAWNYTFKTYLAFTAPVWLDLSGVNKSNKAKQAMITLYDLLSTEHRTILMASISKSGSVQKNRINSEGRKSMSIPLSEERKEMLKRIAKDSNRRIYQVVEDMIVQEYQRQYSH